jgi:hypothetical protein
MLNAILEIILFGKQSNASGSGGGGGGNAGKPLGLLLALTYTS